MAIYAYKLVSLKRKNSTDLTLLALPLHVIYNGIVERRVFDSTPVLIEYRITESGRQIISVIDAMIDWGLTHRMDAIEKIANQKSAS